MRMRPLRSCNAKTKHTMDIRPNKKNKSFQNLAFFSDNPEFSKNPLKNAQNV